MTRDINSIDQVQRWGARYVCNNYLDRTPGCVSGMIQDLGWQYKLQCFVPLRKLTVVVDVKLVEAPHSNSLLTVPRRCFCCGSLLPVFGVRVAVTFHLTCVHIIFSSVWVAEWPSFGK